MYRLWPTNPLFLFYFLFLFCWVWNVSPSISYAQGNVHQPFQNPGSFGRTQSVYDYNNKFSDFEKQLLEQNKSIKNISNQLEKFLEKKAHLSVDGTRFLDLANKAFQTEESNKISSLTALFSVILAVFAAFGALGIWKYNKLYVSAENDINKYKDDLENLTKFSARFEEWKKEQEESFSLDLENIKKAFEGDVMMRSNIRKKKECIQKILERPKPRPIDIFPEITDLIDHMDKESAVLFLQILALKIDDEDLDKKIREGLANYYLNAIGDKLGSEDIDLEVRKGMEGFIILSDQSQPKEQSSQS